MVGKTCNLATSCPWGSKFDIQHNISCKKGGFIYIRPLIRHNDLRDLTTDMISEVSKDTEIEPKLKLLSGEEQVDQRWYGKRVPNVLLAFGTNNIWKERPSAVDFKWLKSNKSLL